MGSFWHLPYAKEILGTVAAAVAAWLVSGVGGKLVRARHYSRRNYYRLRQALNTFVLIAFVAVIVVLWAMPLQRTGTFLGLLAAGLAIAVREPLLSVAGRIAIFAGHMYNVGDRIEIDKMSGDVISIGFFYTHMMEIGNWIGDDQYSGRIIQFANAKIFGTAVMNYTRNFAFIWDEVQLPITYNSNLREASAILLDIGRQYSHEFLSGAERQVEQMRRYFLVPKVELEPQVYTKVTNNYVGLTLRYFVDPKKRRMAATFIYREVFARIQQRDDISIGSEIMTVTLQDAKGQRFTIPLPLEHASQQSPASKQTPEQQFPAPGALDDNGEPPADALPGDPDDPDLGKKAA